MPTIVWIVLILIGVKILLESLGVLPDFFRCGTVITELLLHTLFV